MAVLLLPDPCFSTGHSALPSATCGGDVAANRSATGCPKEIESDSFHVSGSPDSCYSMEVTEIRDPIKDQASFQHPMPQCPPLNSPLSPNVLRLSFPVQGDAIPALKTQAWKAQGDITLPLCLQ